MPGYRKVFTRTWTDERFRTLSRPEKLVALYILTGPQTNRIGLFAFSLALGAEHLGTSKKRLDKMLAAVCKILRWKWDSEARVIYLPTWWRYNPPANADHLKGCLSDLGNLPETPLADEFKVNVRDLPAAAVTGFKRLVGDGAGIVSDTVSPTLPHTGPRTVSVSGTEAETGAEEGARGGNAESHETSGLKSVFSILQQGEGNPRTRDKTEELKTRRAVLKAQADMLVPPAGHPS